MTTTMTDQALSLLSIRDNQVAFDNEQKTALIDVLNIRHASDADLAFFFHLCRSVQLDPFRKQIYLIGRETWNPDTKTKEWRQTAQTGIDGYRVIAERAARRQGLKLKRATFVYYDKDGTVTDAWWKEEPPAQIIASVTLGDEEPCTWPARWHEYVPMIEETKWEEVDGKNKKVKTGKWVPQGMWAKRPTAMLEKCAEAGALRKACPEDLSGIYTFEEMPAPDEADRPITRLVDLDSVDHVSGSRNWMAEVEAAKTADALREIYRASNQAGERTPDLADAITARGKVLAAAEEAAKADEPETSGGSEVVDGDAPDCSNCKASNAGSREEPHLCEVCAEASPEDFAAMTREVGHVPTEDLPEDLCPSCGAAPDQEHSEACEIPVGEGE